MSDDKRLSHLLRRLKALEEAQAPKSRMLKKRLSQSEQDARLNYSTEPRRLSALLTIINTELDTIRYVIRELEEAGVIPE